MIKKAVHPGFFLYNPLSSHLTFRFSFGDLRVRMSAQGQRRNAARFVLLEDLEMDRLTFSRRILQRELGFNPSQLDFVFALPGRKTFEVVFTTLSYMNNAWKDFKERRKSLHVFKRLI